MGFLPELMCCDSFQGGVTEHPQARENSVSIEEALKCKDPVLPHQEGFLESRNKAKEKDEGTYFSRTMFPDGL